MMGTADEEGDDKKCFFHVMEREGQCLLAGIPFFGFFHAIIMYEPIQY